MTTKVSLTILRLALGLVVAGYSFALIEHQLHGRIHHALFLLAFAELVAAILFLIPRTIKIGGVSLIVVFIAAAAFHILHGDYSVAYLAVYAAAAFAVISGERHR